MILDGPTYPTDTFIDGDGALKDQPLTPGARIRFVPDPGNRERDISVRLVHREDGTTELEVAGMWRPLVVRQIQPNRVTVQTPERPTP